jgi:type VII secretion protein EccB
MGTRHEQVQAHRFVTRRIVSALLSGEPETTERPMRRFGLSLFGSLLVAAIVFAIIGIYGFLNPAGGRPANGDLLIMRETGARYAMVDGTLHPVLNWTSALLFAGNAQPNVRQMSRKSLAGYRVGAPIGIPGAPDPPPDRKSLLGLPWWLCSVPGVDGGNPTAQVLVGRTPAGDAAPADLTLLVTTGASPTSGERYLLWQDRRYRVGNQSTLTALELAATAPVRISAGVLNGITRGPDLVPPRIANIGKPSSKKINGANATIGQVYRSGQSHYVLTEAGLAPVGEVTARLLLVNDPRPIDISAAEAARYPVPEPIEPANFPTAVPRVPQNQNELAMVCAAHRGDERNGRVSSIVAYSAVAERLGIPASASAAQVGADGVRTADRVLVANGRGALVRAAPAPGVTAETTVYLVTDQGLRYPLRSTDAVNAFAALGYGGRTPTQVPAAMLALIPLGPTLDPTAAAQLYRPPAPGPTPTASPRAAQPSPSPSATGGSAAPSGSGANGAGSRSPSPSASR